MVVWIKWKLFFIFLNIISAAIMIAAAVPIMIGTEGIAPLTTKGCRAGMCGPYILSFQVGLLGFGLDVFLR